MMKVKSKKTSMKKMVSPFYLIKIGLIKEMDLATAVQKKAQKEGSGLSLKKSSLRR
jgi:hypothetical protein